MDIMGIMGIMGNHRHHGVGWKDDCCKDKDKEKVEKKTCPLGPRENRVCLCPGARQHRHWTAYLLLLLLAPATFSLLLSVTQTLWPMIVRSLAHKHELAELRRYGDETVVRRHGSVPVICCSL